MKIISVVLILILFVGCSASYHKNAVHDDTKDRISAGTVQREIRIGMPSADVITILGAPNMVTTDGQRRESWVYDKIATERVVSSSSFGGNTGSGVGGSYGNTGAIGVLGFGGKSSAGASSTTQRTLTIIIKFDEQGMVRDYSYRQSSF